MLPVDHDEMGAESVILKRAPGCTRYSPPASAGDQGELGLLRPEPGRLLSTSGLVAG